MTRSQTTLAFNLQQKITAFSQNPSSETKAEFLKTLKEVRDMKAPDIFFSSQVDNVKNKKFIDHIRADEKRRASPKIS
jgi:hypothetical protein